MTVKDDIGDIKVKLARIDEHLRVMNGQLIACPTKHNKINEFMTRINTLMLVFGFLITTIFGALIYVYFQKMIL